jgi:hypothetical protein
MSGKGASKPLTRDEILGANDLRLERVETPEWGGSGFVFVRGMTARERDEYDASLLVRDQFSLADMRSKLASMTICDETGKRTFSKDDVDALAQKSGAAMHRVFKTSQELSGLLSNAEVAEALRNLKNARPASSPTG